MALKSRNTALAIKIQSVRGTYSAPNSTTDLLSGVANCRPSIEGITLADDSYTGSIFQNADQILGKRFSVTFDVKLDAPGSLPAANAFVLGRLLQAAKFTEVRTATAIPAAPEAVGTSSTTAAVLGSSASTTDDLYKGFPLILSDNGSTYMEKLTAIRDYIGSTKSAELFETLSGAPAANYQIPTFLGYYRDVTSADPIILSGKLWMGGWRLDLYDLAVTGMRILLPTSTKNTPAFPRIEFTLSGTISADADEATPTIPATGSIPGIKGGDVWFKKQRIGTADVTIDLGLTADDPPNANQPDGTDAPELSGGTANATLVMQKYLKATLDSLGLADAQGYHPFWMQWGTAAWNNVQVTIPDARLNFPNIDLSGGIILENNGLFIDVIDRNLGIVFAG